MPRPPHILHLHSSFDVGGKELRTVRLINAFGRAAEHALVSGNPERRAAAAGFSRTVRVRWPKFPPLDGKPWPGRLKKLARAMAGYDLICTYNWGAMDAVLAHTLFADFYHLPPLVHHEDGFNEDEANQLNRKRNIYRRVALGRTSALVVPSRQLETVALEVWQQPRSRVRLVPNGVDTAAFQQPPKRDAVPGLVKRRGELWVGTLAGLRKVKDLPALVRAFAKLPEPWQLVIAGEGPERSAIVAEAERLGIDDRVHLPGFVAPERLTPLLDVFALSSRSEQAPLSVIEAMSAGVPVVSPRVGDVGAMVASDNGPYLTDTGDEDALGEALMRLAGDAALRKRIGEANRAKAMTEFDERVMVERYRALYWNLMGRTPPAA